MTRIAQNQRYSGFGLIEIVVSLFIFSVLLALFLAMIRNNSSAIFARHQEEALSIARNKMNGLRNGGAENLPPNGQFEDALMRQLPSGTANISTSDYNDGVKNITVTVSWKEPFLLEPSNVSLTTLVANVGGLP